MDAQPDDDAQLARNWTLAGQFVRDIAHDVNNYLGAILAYSELFALDARGNAALREMVGEIGLSVRKSSALVDTLASLVGRDLVSAEPVVLNELLADVIAVFQRALDRSGVHVLVSMPDTPCRIFAVRSRLVRLFVHTLRSMIDGLAASPAPRTLEIALDCDARHFIVNIRASGGDAPPQEALGEASDHADYHRGRLEIGAGGATIRLACETGLGELPA